MSTSEMAPKHDGKLDVDGDTAVRIDGYPHVQIDKQGVETVFLAPAQALSLLDWLLQEKAELQRLAKEQP